MDIGDVTVDQRGLSLWVIRLTGEHDLSNVSQLRAALYAPCQQHHGGGVVVDLGECDFIDSSVIATLISARDRIIQADGQFAVVAPDGSFTRNVLTIAGVTPFLNVCDSLDDAIALLDGPESPQAAAPGAA